MGKNYKYFKTIKKNIKTIKKTIKAIKTVNIISSGGKSYKHFDGYFYNDHKVKPFHIVLPKTSEYVKSYDGQTK